MGNLYFVRMKGGLLMKKRNVFVLGALLGAAAVALLTPKSGKEMQKELLNKVDEIQNKIKDIEIEDVKQSFTAKLDEIKDLVNNFDWESSKAELESKVNDVKEKLNDMLVRVEEAKDTVKDEVKSFGDDLEDDFTIVIDAVKDGAKDVKEKATEAASNVVETVKEVAIDAKDKAKVAASNVADTTKEVATDMVDAVSQAALEAKKEVTDNK